VFRIKCAGQNNFTTNHFRSSAISGLFKAYFMPFWMYRSQRSTYRRKAAAESFLLLIRATPSQLFMRTAWDSERFSSFWPFFVFNSSDDKIYLNNRQGLVLIRIVNQSFYSRRLLAALARAAVKMRASVTARTGGGNGF
jgi:hypothetical protein